LVYAVAFPLALAHFSHILLCAVGDECKNPLLFIYLAIWSERVLYIGSQTQTLGHKSLVPIYINYQNFASHLLINSACHLCNNKSLPQR